MSTTRPVKKKAVSGSIDPRWPKPKVVKWLEIGAIPAIVGLWLPDWLGSYGGAGASYLPWKMPAFPPLLTYVGAVILLVAGYQGIKNMGLHFRAVIACGALSVGSALASVIAQLVGAPYLSLLATGLAAVFGVGFLWFTIGKVAEITQESRTRAAWLAVGVLTVLTAGVYVSGLYLLWAGHDFGFALLRTGVALLTLDFLVCRYGVYCYKTQTSIGAGFRDDPDSQYWTTA